jgi:hypothetical protein
MLLAVNRLTLQRLGRFALTAAFVVFFVVVLGFVPTASQEVAPKPGAPPKYDLQAETKAKGVVDEIKTFDLGTRKDFIQLIVKNGSDRVVIYLCPKPYEDEMGLTFAKGDEISFTGSKVRQESADVILVRELVKGTDTLMFRDGKGNPVWDWRTGK